MPTQILLTGATGYIGGSVLTRLLAHPDAGSLEITAIVRSVEKAEKLEAFGVKAVVGSHSDEKLVEKLASRTDVMLSMAHADNLGAAQATLRGLKRRYQETGTTPAFIHTVSSSTKQKAIAQRMSYTMIPNPDQFETLPENRMHRAVDLTLLRADKEGYVKTYIVLPSTIYGIASNELTKAGIQNPHSKQVPQLVRAALGRGVGGTVGAGKNIWPDVHIDDVADLYIILYDAIHRNPEGTGHGREGIYFGENWEHTMYQVGQAICEGLIAIGKGTEPEPTPFTQEDIEKYLRGSTYLGTNSRCRANRGRSLGWKPRYTNTDFLESIKLEVKVLAKALA